MIRVSGSVIDPKYMKSNYPSNSIESKIVDILYSSNEVYEYDTLDQLKFELNLRANIVNSSKELYRSHIKFKTFRKSICNPNYWDRADNGGFILREGIKSYNAIKDIYVNGVKYGTECATAMVIVYYGALLNIFSETLFNELFSKIQLMNWHNLDKNLAIKNYENAKDYLPGDCRYFKNPDVNPITPEWQGENAIDLGNKIYYGHGIGIKTETEIINALNKKRKNGATESAYLLNSVTRQNYKFLANKSKQ